MRRKESISAVLPSLNEEENIRDAVLALDRFLKANFSDYEMIAVDDGSTDRTGQILEDLQKSLPFLRVIGHKRNLGYGASLREAFAKATKEYVFFTDSDMQFDVREISLLLPLAEKYDIVVGYRHKRCDPFLRIFLSWGYNFLARRVFGLKIRDIDCAFKLFRRSVFDVIKIKSRNFFASTEIMAKARYYGFTCIEVPVTHYPRRKGHTTVKPSNIPRTLAEMAKIWKDIHLHSRKV
jgi:glycosyltransferase involved in cell wall biosynthesis